MFPPLPLLVKDGLVTAVCVGVEVVQEEYVGADRFRSGSTGRIAGTDAQEGGSVLKNELRTRPSVEALLFAVECLQASVGFEVTFIWSQESFCGILRCSCQDDVLIPSREHAIHHDKHDDCRLGKLSAPAEDFEPVVIVYHSLDCSCVEGCELVLRIAREKVFDPCQRVLLQLGSLACFLRLRQVGFYGGGIGNILEEFLPLFMFELVF